MGFTEDAGEQLSRATEDSYRRDETLAHRLDRNYSELLQELRVAETGVQILFAFLLTIAFQPRFDEIGTAGRAVYLITLVSCAVAAVLLIAPVAVHRRLFAQHRKGEIVRLTAALAQAGLIFVGVSILGAVLLVVSFVANWPTGIAVAAALGMLVLVSWVFLAPRRGLAGEGPTITRDAGPVP